MKKIINIIMLIALSFSTIMPVNAYQYWEHERDQKYLKDEKRRVNIINNYSQKGDYVIGNTETIKLYYNSCNNIFNLFNCYGVFFYNIYQLNNYENRTMVINPATTRLEKQQYYKPEVRETVPVYQYVKYFGSSFEISFFQKVTYWLRGYNTYSVTNSERVRVYNLWRFRYEYQYIPVTRHYAQPPLYRYQFVGYISRVVEPARMAERYIQVIDPPKTINYKAHLGVASEPIYTGLFMGLFNGAKRTIDFGGQVISAISKQDVTEITFIKDGQKYVASVFDRGSSATDIYAIMIMDYTKNTIYTAKVTLDQLANNPEEISTLLGEVLYAFTLAGSIDKGLKGPEITIISDHLKIAKKSKESSKSLAISLQKHGNVIDEIITKHGDEAINIINKNNLPTNIIQDISRKAVDIDDFRYRISDMNPDGTSKYLRSIALEIIDDSKYADIWDKVNKFTRGNIIDSEVMGNNLGHYFPVIDRINLETRTVHSFKSMDTRSKSYQTTADFKRKLKEYVDELDGFIEKTYGSKTVDINDYDYKILDLVIPDEQLNVYQKNAIEEIKSYAASKNIKFDITIVK